jgi:hypothetical protein
MLLRLDDAEVWRSDAVTNVRDQIHDNWTFYFTPANSSEAIGDALSNRRELFRVWLNTSVRVNSGRAIFMITRSGPVWQAS